MNPAAGGQQNSPQIETYLIHAEHLRRTEGLELVALVWSTETRWKRGHSGSRLIGRATLGDRSWGQDAQ